MHDKTTTLVLAAGIGFVAGMRSMTAPALVSRHRAQQPDDNTRLGTSSRTANVLGVLAAGEMVGDKTPFVPDRTDWPSVAGRALSGGGSAAVLAADRGDTPGFAALVGSAAAVGSTFLSYHLRKKAKDLSGLPDPLLGLVEDGLALTLGSKLTATAD